MKKRTSAIHGAKARAPSAAKAYWEMDQSELRAATTEFDQEFVGETFACPTAKQKTQWERAQRKRGRPKTGLGSQTISVTIERGLLAKTDRLAKKLKLSRAALIARGLRTLVGAEVVQ
jgi:hypothetical protein